jgi:hypothetical protein
VNTCATCKFWGNEYIRHGLHFCNRAERIWEAEQWSDDSEMELTTDSKIFVEDGSSYWAALLTKPDFGCVEWVKKEESAS